MKIQPSWEDTAVGVGVLLLALLIAWQTSQIPTAAIYARVGPAIFPWIVAVFFTALGIALVWQGLTGGWEKGEALPEYDIPGAAWLGLGLLLNLVLIENLGFIIASTVMFVCVARAFGSRKLLRDAGIGFALAFVAYIGFDRLLGYKIGSGIIENLI